MAEKHKKHPFSTFIALAIIGVASSFSFVFTAFAAGMAPDDIIALVNNSRTKATLSPLSANAKLTEAAKSKANDMIKNDYFAHTSPKGVEPWYWIKQAGYQYKAAGENLAINYTDAKEQHEAWMKSETHRANIMSARYQEIGVAVVRGKIDGKESIVTVEMFGAPLVAAADHMALIPPAGVPIPTEAKTLGVETETVVSVADEFVKEVETLVPAQTPVIQMMPIPPMLTELTPDTTWLLIAWAIVLSICAIVAPTLFVSRAYEILMQQSKKPVSVVTVTVKKEEISERTPSSMDGIHKLLAH